MKKVIIIVLVIVALFLATVAGIFLRLILPAALDAREAARQTQNHYYLKTVSLGIINYSYKDNTLPPAYTEKDGKRLHSWRVLILPYINGGQALYDQIHLDEPWDSEWNKQFHDKCPKIFKNPVVQLAPSETTYAVVVGENTAFSGATGVNLNSIKDGLAHTGMLVERTPVCWMDPNSDIPFEEAIKGVGVSENGIQTYSKGKFTVVTADDAIITLPSNVSSDFLKNLFDTKDGNDIDFENPEK